MLIKSLSQPILDLHVHVGPELIKRKYSPDSLAAEAGKSGIGFAAKNHFRATTADASRLDGKNGIPVIGSVVMNLSAGGISIHAVHAGLSGCKVRAEQAELDKQRFIVWMPTIHAEAHLIHNNRFDILTEWGGVPEYQTYIYPGSGLSVFEGGITKSGPVSKLCMLTRETLEVLDLIASKDLILATGHISAAEVESLVPEAVKRGVRRIILTHPLYQATALSASAQKDLCNLPGVYTELCFVNIEIDAIPLESYVEVIRVATPEKVILSTDLGQVNRRSISEGWKAYYEELIRQGISHSDFETMAATNPHKLVFGDQPA